MSTRERTQLAARTIGLPHVEGHHCLCGRTAPLSLPLICVLDDREFRVFSQTLGLVKIQDAVVIGNFGNAFFAHTRFISLSCFATPLSRRSEANQFVHQFREV
jgi:hypothetical protein